MTLIDRTDGRRTSPRVAWALVLAAFDSIACTARVLPEDKIVTVDAEADGGDESGPDVNSSQTEGDDGYTACEVGSDCQLGHACVAPVGEAGYCAAPCRSDSDCPRIAGDEGESECFSFDGGGLCGVTCPRGDCPPQMRCEEISIQGRGLSLCF